MINNLNIIEFKLLFLKCLIYKGHINEAIAYAKKIGLKNNEKDSECILNFLTKINLS
jgi:hypothetical protein